MEGNKSDQDLTLQALPSPALQNPPPISAPITAHLLHRPFLARFLDPHGPLHPLLAVRSDDSSLSIHHLLEALPLRKELGENTQLLKVQIQQRIDGGRLQQQQLQGSGAIGQQEQLQEPSIGWQEDQVRADSEEQRASKPMGGRIAQSEIQMHGQQEPPCGRTGEEPVGRTYGRTSDKPIASIDYNNNKTNRGARMIGNSGCGKDMANDLLIQEEEEDEEEEVSSVKALSHIAHIKRKPDCMDAHPEAMQASHPPHIDPVNKLAPELDREPSSKNKKFKQVQFELEPLAYQKLMKILIEQHEGSFQRFVMAILNAHVVLDKPEKRAATIIQKPAFSKWKRTRFDQLKGTETQELALAFRSLAESTPGVGKTPDFMNTPWQELNMSQIEKMLEETKKMLLVNEKVQDCPHADCGRRFSTPRHLRDHLNEHSGEQPYSCSFEDCLHRFRSKQLLCRHMKKHERAHRCTFEGCNKRFAFREGLIVHQKIHSDERPLSCPWEGCGKTFKWANSLHGHMRTHTGEKPYQCTFAGCGRLFGYKVDLTRHRRTHFGQPARSSH